MSFGSSVALQKSVTKFFNWRELNFAQLVKIRDKVREINVL